MIATWLFSHYQNFPFAWTTNGPYEFNIKIRELCCCCHSWPPKGHLAIIQSFMWEWMENIRELVSLLRSSWSITSTPYFLWFVIIYTQCIFSSKNHHETFLLMRYFLQILHTVHWPAYLWKMTQKILSSHDRSSNLAHGHASQPSKGVNWTQSHINSLTCWA